MVKSGVAIAHGAITIVNAISCGLGAALGIKLWTEATVKITDEPHVIKGEILSDPSENIVLIEKTVKKVLKYLDLETECGAHVETRSNIPIARGLKSSSAAANAIALATFAALKADVEDLKVVKLGVEAALDAQVTITGAFDDACASYLGNIVITNNELKKIIQQYTIDETEYTVLIHVPPEKKYTINANSKKMRSIAREVKTIHKEAIRGNYWSAMTLNGIIYSAVLGFNPEIALDAILNGAVAASLSGKGPAVAAIIPNDYSEQVMMSWKTYHGTVIQTKINSKKASILR